MFRTKPEPKCICHPDLPPAREYVKQGLISHQDDCPAKPRRTLRQVLDDSTAIRNDTIIATICLVTKGWLPEQWLAVRGVLITVAVYMVIRSWFRS